MRLKNKVTFITGGGSGIGKCTAELFAKEGSAVAIVDRNGDKAKAVADSINSKGGKAIAIEADVTSESQIIQAVKTTVENLGPIDILVNHAGVIPDGDTSILDVEEKTIDQGLAINVKGMMLVGKQVSRSMRDAGKGGTIVNTASDLSQIALAGLATYVTSKTAIPGLTRAMATDLAAFNIRVNAVAPGFIYTEMTAGLANNEEIMEPMRETYLLKQLGQPIDVANCILFLASDESAFCTGSILTVDGGHVVR
ncbi:MAG: glucose 1-dehydrogenase [Bacteroidia bacterium]|nr:glucose 1-dehydrogenase [Bacteroidia bacterium]